MSEQKEGANKSQALEQQKVPGAFMRLAIRAQAVINLVVAAATPIIAAVGIARKQITVPLLNSKKTFDLSSPASRAGAAAIGVGAGIYGVMNAVSRLRTAKDAATQEKVNEGKLDPAEADMKSGPLDVAMTRVNAVMSGGVSLASGVFTARSLANPNLSAEQKAQQTTKAIATMAATGAMSVSKWKAANAAAVRLKAEPAEESPPTESVAEMPAEPVPSHRERLLRDREQATQQCASRG